MKIKITREKIIVLASAMLIILLVLTIYPNIKLPIYSIDYYGTKMSFRVNLRDAKSVIVYPSEEIVRREIMNQFVENITIVFKPGEGEVNGHYALEVFEIVNKLAVAYRLKFSYMPNFNVINITSYENLTGKIQNPIIALIHPIYSNETSVKLDNHVIYIQGKNVTSPKEQLKNFDLATVKFLMAALDIEI